MCGNSSIGYRNLASDENEINRHLNTPKCRRRIHCSSSNAFKILISCFAIVMLGSSVFILLDGPQIGVIYPPKIRNIPVTFNAHHLYASASSPESNAAWDDLLPEGRGFVLVENPEDYNLLPGLPTEMGIDRYSVSVFHQLHCLAMVRESYFALMQDRDPQIFAEESLSGKQKTASHSGHIGHCFDYLRQAIMCAADTTLEWAIPNKASVRTVDGWGVTHDCRSWDDAVDWTLKHRAPQNRSGIV